MESDKVVCLMSGGLDSSTLAVYYKRMGFDVYAVSVNYGQKHSKELEAADAIAKQEGIQRVELNLSQLKSLLAKSALTSEMTVPEQHYTDSSQKQTVVPNRNMILLSIAVGYAITLGAKYVAYAAHASDYAIYPDCRETFVNPLQEAVVQGNYDKVRILTPFMFLSKGEIVALALRLNVPLEKTWSCYKGEDRPCLRCGTCRERTDAFVYAKAVDPSLDWREWEEAKRVQGCIV